MTNVLTQTRFFVLYKIKHTMKLLSIIVGLYLAVAITVAVVNLI